MITLSHRRFCEALERMGLVDNEYGHYSPAQMALVLLVLRRLADEPDRFPAGKWGSIQEIERQLDEVVSEMCARIERGESCE